jgi:hypothetical protein
MNIGLALSMPAYVSVSMLNPNRPDLGIPGRTNLKPSRVETEPLAKEPVNKRASQTTEPPFPFKGNGGSGSTQKNVPLPIDG